MADANTALITTLLLTLGAFLIFREIVCWYWKINEMIKLFKRNNELLETIAKNTTPQVRPPVRDDEPLPDVPTYPAPLPGRNPITGR